MNSVPTQTTPAPKSTGVAFLLWFFLGGFGAHRMYCGRMGSGLGMLGLNIGSAVLSLILIGLVGYVALFVWWIVDAFLIKGWCEGPATQQVAGTIDPPTSQAA